MLGGKAIGQIAQPLVYVSGQRQVSAESDSWREVAAAGSLTDPMRVVLCTWGEVPVLTTDGGLHYPDSFQSGPNLIVGDPFVVTVPASSPTDVGRIYVGGVYIDQSNGSANTHRITFHDETAGTWSENPVWQVVAHGGNHPAVADKPWLAVGPSPADPQATQYTIVYSATQCSVASSTERLFQAYSSSSAGIWPTRDVLPRDPQTTGDPPNQVPASCHYRSWGILPHILDNGDIVAVLRDPPKPVGGLYNTGLPVFIWSDNGGVDWLPSQSQPVRLAENLTTALRTKYDQIFQIGDTPYYVDNGNNAPAIAIDRTTQPNTIYIAFAARHQKDPVGDDVIDGNSDIWIVRGSYNQQAQAYVFPSDSTNGYFHLTDAMLGLQPHADGAGPDQWVPAIAIDCMGGINLMFYDNRVEAVAPMVPDGNGFTNARMVDVYYARITGWPGTNPKVFKARLTPSSFPIGNATASGLGNDYVTIATAGPNGRRVYPVYTARKTLADSAWSKPICYMHSVVIAGCSSDLNLNSISDSGDVELYLDDYGAEEAAADLTVDGMVNGDDFDVFVDAYVSGS